MLELTPHEQEMRQRVTRIESRICRIADALNVPTGDPSKTMWIMPTVHAHKNTVCIGTTVLDASISDVLRFLIREGIEGKVACVYFDGLLVARIYPEGTT